VLPASLLPGSWLADYHSIIKSLLGECSVMKPSTIVFIPAAVMSICALAAAYAGFMFLAVAAIVLAGLAYRLVLSLEEAGK